MSQTPALAFTVDRARLASAVARVAKFVRKSDEIPILANVLLKVENGRIAVRGTNLDVDAVVVVEGATIDAAGTLCVPARSFGAALERWPDGELRVESDGRQLVGRIKRSRATFPVLPEVDFPDIRKGNPSHTFRIPGSDLSAMAAKCGFAIGTDANRPALMGIYFHVVEDMLSAVATDGHRLSQLLLPMAEGAEDMVGVIVPGSTIKLWSHLLAKDESEPVMVEVSPNFIRFSSDAMVLHSQLMNDTYPAYQRVIPRDNPHVALANLSDLASAVDRLLVFVEKESRAFRFEFSKGEVRILLTSPTSEAEETIAAECDFDLTIGFNGKYLREILTTLKGPKVRFALQDPGSPSLLSDEEDARRQIVIMPMRV